MRMYIMRGCVCLRVICMYADERVHVLCMYMPRFLSSSLFFLSLGISEDATYAEEFTAFWQEFAYLVNALELHPQ